MKNNENTRGLSKISASQLFCVLLLSRLCAEISRPALPESPETALLGVIIAETMRFVFALPLIIFSMKKRDIIAEISKKSRAASIIAGIFLSAALAFFTAASVMRGSEYACRTVGIGMSFGVILAITAVFAVYSAIKGAEAVMRAGCLFFALAALMTVICTAAAAPGFKAFGSPQSIADGLFGDIMQRVLYGGEYVAFAALLPRVNAESSASSAGIWLGISSLLLPAALVVTVYLTLRELAPHADFPYSAAASVGSFVLMNRLDPLYSAVWSLCMIFRSSLFFTALCTGITRISVRN